MILLLYISIGPVEQGLKTEEEVKGSTGDLQDGPLL
jgi:hypothetical protein